MICLWVEHLKPWAIANGEMWDDEKNAFPYRRERRVTQVREGAGRLGRVAPGARSPAVHIQCSYNLSLWKTAPFEQPYFCTLTKSEERYILGTLLYD